ncbi:helix-turn-helix domain-containing protein [soil metagenome]
MTASRLGAAAAAIGSLADDLRLGMYLFIRRRGRPVSREEAAEEVGISRKLAAYHLDKLVDRGLLQAHYARPAGRSGPGAGRSSKLYETCRKEIAVSLPPRAYDLAGGILVEAIEQAGGEESAREAALRVARSRGIELGEQVRRAAEIPAPGGEREPSNAEHVLSEHGYEPYRDEAGGTRLRNCPFHVLARMSPALVCGLNRAFVDGLLSGVGDESVQAILEPRTGQCCVHLRPRDEPKTAERASGRAHGNQLPADKPSSSR